MPSQLGKFTLLKTLGTGANSKVKLAIDKSDGTHYAVKILKKGNPNLDHKFLELLMTEVQTMKDLSHLNIVNMNEYSQDGVVEKTDGRKEPVIYLVLELATGGELFDYVASTGRFSEEIARFYFKQMIDGLDYVHKKGITHRDMKPENVLYDANFNLKVADFGFAAPMAGRDGTGTCKTKLGTESYMAPEIHLRKPYNGASVDLFAASIILFIMVTQHPPFSKAVPDDPFYRLICANRADLFWKAHAKNKTGGLAFFSEEFMNLITSMLQLDPTHRLSMAEVKAHPWMAGPTETLEGVQSEFGKRKQAIDAENEAKRKQKEAERASKAASGGAAHGGRRAYKGAHRGDADEEGAELTSTDILSKKRVLDEYVGIVSKNTEFFTKAEPDVILQTLIDFVEAKGAKLTIADGKYKAKTSILTEDDRVDIKMEITKFETDKFAVEFSKGYGDQLAFFEHFNTIKDYFGELIDA